MFRFTIRDGLWLMAVIAVLLGWFRADLCWIERECQRSAEYERIGIGYSRAIARLRQHEPGITGKGILPPLDPRPAAPLPSSPWRGFFVRG